MVSGWNPQLPKAKWWKSSADVVYVTWLISQCASRAQRRHKLGRHRLFNTTLQHCNVYLDWHFTLTKNRYHCRGFNTIHWLFCSGLLVGATCIVLWMLAVNCGKWEGSCVLCSCRECKRAVAFMLLKIIFFLIFTNICWSFQAVTLPYHCQSLYVELFKKNNAFYTKKMELLNSKTN